VDFSHQRYIWSDRFRNKRSLFDAAALIASGLFSAAFAAVQQRLKNKNTQSGAGVE